MDNTFFPSKIAIVYHSGYGHTKQQAEAVRIGAASVNKVKVDLLAIDADGNLDQAAWDTLDKADAIIFGSPTYMGNTSWQFKKFADASSAAWFTQKWKNKLAAGFTNSASMNGDKHSTLHYLITLAMQQGMVWVGTGMMPANSTASARNDINYLGSYSGLMAQSPSDSSPENGPLPGDLETAKLFGVHVAEATMRWSQGK